MKYFIFCTFQFVVKSVKIEINAKNTNYIAIQYIYSFVAFFALFSPLEP